MTAKRMLRTTGRVLGLLLALSSVLLVASQALGGPVSTVVTHGSSMEPAYHEGDLVLVRKAHYEPGDVVAYRSTQLRAIVMHRIVRFDGDRFVFKGDANTWLDAERPARSDLVGKSLVRLPRAGKIVAALRTPRGLGFAVAGAVLLAASRLGFRRRRRGRPRASREVSADIVPSRSSRGNARTILVALGAGALISGILSIAAFVLPTGSRTAASASFEHTGIFDYSARVTKGPVYQRGIVGTGDPVYLKLAPSLEVRFAYRFRSATEHAIAVNGRFVAEVSDDAGWKRSFEIQPSTSSTGDRAELRGRLDVAKIWRVIDNVQRLTGIQSGSYRLAIVPEVHVTGTVRGGRIDEEFSPRLPLQFDRLLLRLAQVAPSDSATADQPLPDPLEPSQSGAVKLGDGGRAQISFGGVRLDATTARRIPIVASLAFMLALASVIWRTQAGPNGDADEAGMILRRHRTWIVPITARLPRPTSSVVDVASIDSLLRLAERSGRMILHEGLEAHGAFLLEDDATTYRYIPRSLSTDPKTLTGRHDRRDESQDVGETGA